MQMLTLTCAQPHFDTASTPPSIWVPSLRHSEQHRLMPDSCYHVLIRVGSIYYVLKNQFEVVTLAFGLYSQIIMFCVGFLFGKNVKSRDSPSEGRPPWWSRSSGSCWPRLGRTAEWGSVLGAGLWKGSCILPAASRLPKLQFIYDLTGPSSPPLLESDWAW